MEKKIRELICSGEKINVEFKESYNKLPRNLFESVCSFLNRDGGYIILGVDDNRKVVGVDKAKIESLKREFTSLCNNLQKINPTIYLSLQELSLNRKTILYAYIPESSNVHSTNGRIFDRNEDGDFDITGNLTLISNMYIRKKKTYFENNIYPYVSIHDLRKDLIERARVMACNKNRKHPWGKMNDLELLKSASLYDVDYETGKEGFNLACILLFGKDEVIHSVLPYFRVDALFKIKDIDRYDDRDDIRTNLMESLDRLSDFIAKHLPDPFYLENNQRISLRDTIARELCVNLLIHREYSNPAVTRLIIMKNEIYAENANRAKMIGYIKLDDFVPYPKNPIIAKFFSEIGLADELGSGFRKLKKYVKLYSNGLPKFKEDDMFISEIPLNCFEHLKTEEEKIIEFNEPNSKYDRIILDFCVTAKTSREIQEYIGIKNQRYFMKSILKPLIEKNQIFLTVPDKPRSSKQMYITYKK